MKNKNKKKTYLCQINKAVSQVIWGSNTANASERSESVRKSQQSSATLLLTKRYHLLSVKEKCIKLLLLLLLFFLFLQISILSFVFFLFAHSACNCLNNGCCSPCNSNISNIFNSNNSTTTIIIHVFKHHLSMLNQLEQ